MERNNIGSSGITTGVLKRSPVLVTNADRCASIDRKLKPRCFTYNVAVPPLHLITLRLCYHNIVTHISNSY
uniref:Ovule protein n=1 Tax=Heterorhabditis bacteriophora TaxID=37862 RepID=A0A1I7X2B0_HETBA